jgi:glutamate-1-semialdehyde 2,1-aminomutase
VIPFNDTDAAKIAFEKYKGKIAAVLVEPVAANMGVVTPVDGYLQSLRDLCSQNDSLLIFDEVITGFRLALGGAQELFNIKADITCLGKIIGGGLPAAVYQAGTLSGNPLATAAANATLDILANEDCYQQLESSSALLETGLADAAQQTGIAVTINRTGSIMSCFFTNKKIRNFSDVKSTNIKRFKKFFALMLKRGIYLAPSAYEAMFVSLAHSKIDIITTIEAAKESFHKINMEK